MIYANSFRVIKKGALQHGIIWAVYTIYSCSLLSEGPQIVGPISIRKTKRRIFLIQYSVLPTDGPIKIIASSVTADGGLL